MPSDAAVRKIDSLVEFVHTHQISRRQLFKLFTSATITLFIDSSCSRGQNDAIRQRLSPLNGERLIMATYYIAENGKDSNPGTQSKPWATFTYALSKMASGDVLRVKPGTYNNQHFVVDKAVTIKADSSSPLLKYNDGGYPIKVTAAATLDGLTVQHTQIRRGRDEFIFVTGDRAVIKNCTIFCSAVTNRTQANQSYKSGDKRAGIRVGANTVTIENCEIYGINFGVGFQGMMGKNSVVRGCNLHHTVQAPIVITYSYEKRGLLIEDCNISYSWIEDGIQFMPDYNGDQGKATISNYGTLIRNCTFIGNSENAIDVKGVGDAVIEGCVFTQTIGSNNGNLDGWNYNSYMQLMIGSNARAQNVIIRNCVFYNGAQAIYLSGKNFKSYNNTVLYNNYDYTGPQSSNRTSQTGIYQKRLTGMGVKNSIFGGHRGAQVTLVAKGIEWDYNIYFAGSDGGSTKVGLINGVKYDWNAWRNKLQQLSGVKGKDAHSAYYADMASLRFVKVDDPPLELPDRYDFTVKPSSPAYQAGEGLTHCTGSGTSSTVPVGDATWFCDGFGSTQYGGDIVTIGSTTARITRIDGNSLVLNKRVTFSNGMPVYWGDSNKPNIGILSQSSVGPPPVAISADFSADKTYGIAPLTVQFSDRSSATNGVAGWSWSVNGMEFSQAQNPVYSFTAPGDYDITLTVTGPDGTDTVLKPGYITVVGQTSSLLVNGDFSDGKTGWLWHTSGVASWAVVNGEAKIDVESTGDNTQLFQRNIQIVEGENYALSAKLRSETGPMSVRLRVMMHNSPYRPLIDETVAVSNREQTFSFSGRAGFSYDDMRITIMPLTPGTLFVDDIQFGISPIGALTADFDASPTTGKTPLVVNFVDASVPADRITSWTWKVNGVEFSRDRNPTHQFDSPGSYSVELTVSGPDGMDVAVKPDFITVSPSQEPPSSAEQIRIGLMAGVAIGIN